MSAIAITDRIGKSYDGFSQIIEQLDLPAREDEYPSLLHPAGSGKTTTGADIRLGGGSLCAAPTRARELPNAAPNTSPRFFEDTSPTLLPKFVSWPFE